MITITTPAEHNGNGYVIIDEDDETIYARDVFTSENMVELLGMLGVGAVLNDVKFMNAYNIAEVLTSLGFEVAVDEIPGRPGRVH